MGVHVGVGTGGDVLLRLRQVLVGVNDLILWPGAHTTFGASRRGYQPTMELLLWILAVILVVSGIFALFRRQVLWGVVLIIVGLLVGPGGVSIFT
jgi:hypothetical protein